MESNLTCAYQPPTSIPTSVQKSNKCIGKDTILMDFEVLNVDKCFFLLGNQAPAAMQQQVNTWIGRLPRKSGIDSEFFGSKLFERIGDLGRIP